MIAIQLLPANRELKCLLIEFFRTWVFNVTQGIDLLCMFRRNFDFIKLKVFSVLFLSRSSESTTIFVDFSIQQLYQ